MSERISVALERRALHVGRAFDLFEELQRELGHDRCYLLESLSGPARDTERAIIGVGPLVTIEVRDGNISVHGREKLAAVVRERVVQSGRVDDELRLRQLSDLWDVLRHVMALFDVPQAGDTRPDFCFLTVLGYDAVHYIEQLGRRITTSGTAAPDLTLVLHDSVLEIDLRTSTGALTTARSTAWEPTDPQLVTSAATRAARDCPPAAPPPSAAADGAASSTVDAAQFEGWVDQALQHIAVGDVYQVQLGYEVSLPTPWDAPYIYRRMRQRNPSPFMGFVPMRSCTLLSASPELHVLLSGGSATMRPIAGTATRTGDPVHDDRAVAHLRTSDKELAEHVMLVDLCRNDLGRVALPGSVETPARMQVEPYSHVFHLVSTVTATVDDRYDVFDVIRATFPAGTMTGAPKIRAMEVIESLEESRRDLYAGVFGVIGFGGYANLALTIRSVFWTPDRTTTRASAGIVADSTPTGEWLETRAKMNAAVDATLGGVLA